MTNTFSGKSSFNKLLLLIGVPLKSIQVKEWNKKNLINRNIYEKKLNNFESEYKRHKSGENPNLGYLEFIYYNYNSCLEYQEA